MFVIILVLSSLLITLYFRAGLPGGRLRREKVDKDGRELPTKKKGGGELPTGGLLASGCTTAYIGIFIIMLGTLPPEGTQPKKLCTANFSSGTLKTLINLPLMLKNKIF